MTNNNRCMYLALLRDFVNDDANAILGKIIASFHGNVPDTAIEAWESEIELLQEILKGWDGEDAYILFEYDIPRLGKRIDVVLLLRGIVFCIEFKVG